MVDYNSMLGSAAASGKAHQAEVYGDGYVAKLIGKGLALARNTTANDRH